jgi:hypothetical protein
MPARPFSIGHLEVSHDADSGIGWCAAVEGQLNSSTTLNANSEEHHATYSEVQRARVKVRRLTTKFSDRTPTVQHAGARHQAAREDRPPAAEHFMVMRLAATPS